ncbi:hypothetical protein AC579_3587 [Pseudocercospora musae]|uniref:Uncharacterized protein n=1 Tax=Pseudocercospora musae TaxID=113226 RepID=A0A139IWI0_9PEZI|nr:hypothetical protein AC579_3587 [Pseudocercospora musae]
MLRVPEFISEALRRTDLSTLIIVTNTDAAFAGQSLGPESANVNVGLWHADVGEEQPGTEDWLGQDVEDSVGNDLLVNVHVAAAISNAPDARESSVSSSMSGVTLDRSLHWVDSPDDQSEATDGSEEVADLAPLGASRCASVNQQLPDDNEVGGASNGVPAPLLWSALRAESSKETGQDHDDIGKDGDEDGATVQAGEKSQVEEKEWSGESPVDVAGPVDLAVKVVLGVWDVLVRLADGDVVVAHAVSSSHGEVRQSSNGGDGGAHHWDAPCHASEDDGGNEHDDEYDPRVLVPVSDASWYSGRLGTTVGTGEVSVQVSEVLSSSHCAHPERLSSTASQRPEQGRRS